MVLDVKHWGLLVEAMLFFKHEGVVDGEGEARDSVEHAQDENKGHGAVNFAVKAKAVVSVTGNIPEELEPVAPDDDG